VPGDVIFGAAASTTFFLAAVDFIWQAKRGGLQHATDRQADCLRNRAKIIELEASLTEMQRRSEGTSTVLQEQTRKWLDAVKALEKTCDTE
jgi:hypothetical protein